MMKFKKVISLFILMIIFLSSIQNIVLGAIPISEERIKRGDAIITNVAFKDKNTSYEVEARYVYYVDNNNKSYPAYCITHGEDGVDERGDYTVDVDTILKNDKVWRVITNGYPYKELGGLSDYEAYFATKQAIYCVLLDDRSASQYTSLGGNGSNIVKAIAKLENIGENGTETKKDVNLQINQSGSFIENGNYYSQTYTVTPDVDVDMGGYIVNEINGFPTGSFIADNKGNSKTSFASGETFKIMIPKSGLTQNINGNITVTSKCKTYPVLVGKTRIPKTQNYALTCNTYEDFTATTTLNLNTNNGKVKVTKVDAESTKPIKDVEFELLKEDGSKVATAKTDAKGIATFSNLHQGNYKLKEIATGENYILTTETFDITVEYNKTTVQDITNEYKKGSLIVNKVDKDNNKIALGNVTFDLFSNEFKKVVGTYATDVNGQLTINNLRIGEYRLIEKDSGKWYELAEDIAIDIKCNETTQTVVENELKKGQIRVIKVDKENDEIKLPDVEFEILDENDKVLEKIVTDANGEALTKRYPLRDFSKLKIRETKTLDNYQLDEVPAIIELEEGITDVILTNVKKRGQVEITKISANDNKITGEKKGTPLKGAVFEIYTQDNVLVDTITTGEDGKGISELLEYGKYYIKEKSTGSENYILNTEKYDFEIKEDGEIVELTIKNKSKEVPPKLPKTGF